MRQTAVCDDASTCTSVPTSETKDSHSIASRSSSAVVSRSTPHRSRAAVWKEQSRHHNTEPRFQTSNSVTRTVFSCASVNVNGSA